MKPKDMILSIKMPYIIFEQYDSGKTMNDIKKYTLSSKFLRILNNGQNGNWSKKILNLLKYKDRFVEEHQNLHNVNSIHKDIFSDDIIKIDINDKSINDNNNNETNENNDDNKDYDNAIMNYHKLKRSSKSFHFKQKKKIKIG